MTKIKLCGLTRPEDITAANVLEPDFVGFVFAPKSRRYVTGEQAGTLRKQLSPTGRTRVIWNGCELSPGNPSSRRFR